MRTTSTTELHADHSCQPWPVASCEMHAQATCRHGMHAADANGRFPFPKTSLRVSLQTVGTYSYEISPPQPLSELSKNTAPGRRASLGLLAEDDPWFVAARKVRTRMLHHCSWTAHHRMFLAVTCYRPPRQLQVLCHCRLHTQRFHMALTAAAQACALDAM